MGIYDQLFGMKPQQATSGMGMLSSLATQPLGINSFGPGGSGVTAPNSTAAPPGPVSADDSSGPSTWQRIAGIVGDALLTGTGHQTAYGPAAQAYARMQMDPVDKAYKRAQTAALLAKPQKTGGEFQQKVSDLVANGATPDDIHSLIQNTVNPIQSVPGVDENGNHIMTLLRPGGMIGGVPTAGAAPSGGGMAVGTVAAGHKKIAAGPDNDPSTWQAIGGAAPSGTATFSPSQAYDAVIQQESGGRAGVTGPQTPYGRAQGLSQMLPATAQAEAAKIGVPWTPALMTGTSPEAASYQRQLGQAYFNEGLDKTGNVYDAARYYFAGPNRAIWGPKTTRYANDIVARLGGQ